MRRVSCTKMAFGLKTANNIGRRRFPAVVHFDDTRFFDFVVD
jgi:hypothetical protein